jgi:hypothetical protein
MKTFYTISDTHGLGINNFELDINTLSKNKDNMIVFMGDYCDSFNFTNEQHINSLLEIIQLKKENPNNVILLLGNHDIAYWYKLDKKFTGISGYRVSYAYDLYDIFNTNKDLFQIAYQYNNYLWTHAGVQNYWFKNIFIATKEEKKTNDIAGLLNNHFLVNNNSLFVVGKMRGGYNRVGGPFWCDERELYNSPIKGYTQIIGHTLQKSKIPIGYISYNNQTYICTDLYWYILKECIDQHQYLWLTHNEDKLKKGDLNFKDMKYDYSKFKIPVSAIHSIKVKL